MTVIFSRHETITAAQRDQIDASEAAMQAAIDDVFETLSRIDSLIDARYAPGPHFGSARPTRRGTAPGVLHPPARPVPHFFPTREATHEIE